MWNLIDTTVCNGDRIDLYERHGAHMIRLNGWELMNGEHHASEDLLGHLAASLARGPEPDILVGGLGLGFTLASLLETLGGMARARVTVAERSGAVIDWFAGHTGGRLAATLPDGVRIIEGDVAEQLRLEHAWDVVVLDVDNGPAALSSSGNATLYGIGGLQTAWRSLRPCGHLLLWSGFEDEGFARRASAVGFSVRNAAVPLRNRHGDEHFIYVLSRELLQCGEPAFAGGWPAPFAVSIIDDR